MSELPISSLPLASLTTLLFDIDGVLTDGQVLTLETGIVRNMNIKDSYALQYAVRQGYRIGIISGGSGIGVKERLAELGVAHIMVHAHHKVKSFENFMQQHNLKQEEVLYMGDDMPDIPLFERVGVSVAPSDAGSDAMRAADWVTQLAGGRGAVREVLETIMKVQGKWYSEAAFTW
ncbi:MAG: HAD-IIIA family hydrolase [Bacteroidota bacterium]